MKKLFAAGLLSAVSLASQASVVFVGKYQVDQGPDWGTNPTVYSATEAAALLFGGSATDYVISTRGNSFVSIDHQGWYSVWGVDGGSVHNENFKIDLGAAGYDSPGGTNSAASAYVFDNARGAQYTNYVFRNEAPEPASLALVLLAVGAGLLATKRQRV